MLAFTKGGKTLVATNRGSDNVSIFELTASDPLFRVPGMEGDDRARMRGT
jgi:6-phosphogluconolactonase (cycloisomerase 2 family)